MVDNMRSRVLIEKNGSNYLIDSRILESIDELKPLVNKKAWDVFRELSKKESYPAEISKKLGLGQQETYYYFKKLREAGLIKIVRKEERKGGLAKFFAASDKAFSLIPALNDLEKSKSLQAISGNEKTLDKELSAFLDPFIREGELDAKIVVGSPDAHGEFKARARDAHLAVELAAFLGSLSSRIKQPLVFLDTMARDLKEENSNLIIVGGPITNGLSRQLNEFLSISFKQKNAQWVIESSVSEREYAEDSIGIIEKLQHPFFDSRYILFLAGKRNAGTRAAILSLLQNTGEIVKGNKFDSSKTAHAVEGLDLDSDGLIDGVELRE